MPPAVAVSPERELIAYIQQLQQTSIDYRSKFLQTWDAIEAQVRLQKPAEWKDKEDWQSQVIIPLQAKKSETAVSELDRVLFPSQFFTIAGTDVQDRSRDDYLITMIGAILERAGFEAQREFWIQEGVDIGLSFLKLTSNAKGDGLVATWVSAYSCTWDPSHRTDWRKWKYWIHEYDMDIADVITQGPSMGFDMDKVQELLDLGVAQSRGRSDDAIRVIRGIDGTSQIKLPGDWTTIRIAEFWGMVKQPRETGGYTFEPRKVVVANNLVVLQNVPNAWSTWGHWQAAQIPVIPIRVKPRKYDFPGKGYLENGVGIQDLANSMVNLGMDSAKISAMDIVVLDVNKVADAASIRYRPIAVWKMRDINGVKIQRQQLSALSDIMRGLALLDAIDQDASGVTRAGSGTPELTTGGEQQTLGEFQLKLARADNRFIKVAKFIEQDSIRPLVQFVYAYLKNAKVFTGGQRVVDRLLGFDEIPSSVVQGVSQPVQRLRLDDLPTPEEMAWDFRPLGVTSFVTKLQTAASLERMLTRAISNEVLAGLTKVDELWRRLGEAEDVPDWRDLVRSPEELQQFIEHIQSTQGPTVGAPIAGRGGPTPKPSESLTLTPSAPPTPGGGL